jgi:hypothetical protein
MGEGHCDVERQAEVRASTNSELSAHVFGKFASLISPQHEGICPVRFASSTENSSRRMQHCSGVSVASASALTVFGSLSAFRNSRLGRLGWSLRRIEQETGVRRETAAGYLKAAGIAIGRPGGSKGRHGSKPATVTTDSGTRIPSLNLQTECEFSKPATVTADLGPPLAENSRQTSASACELYRETIELGLSQGRNAMGIWQDLVDSYGFADGYQSVKRFVRRLRGMRSSEARVIIETAPGEDYGEFRVMVTDRCLRRDFGARREGLAAQRLP